MSDKPFITARQAAELIGAPLDIVVRDIEEGMDGALPALIGGRAFDTWIVYAYEVDGDRLTMHRARLADRETADGR